MALRLALDLPFGFTGDYWRITSFEINLVTGVVVTSVGLYKDEKVRHDAGSVPAVENSYPLTNAAEIIETMKRGLEIMPLMYDALKKFDAFTGAEDC